LVPPIKSKLTWVGLDLVWFIRVQLAAAKDYVSVYVYFPSDNYLIFKSNLSRPNKHSNIKNLNKHY